MILLSAPMDDEWTLIYVTAESFEAAESIGKSLVLENLVGCINIFPTMHSIYQWKGKLETSQESVLIAKTLKSKQNEVEQRILAMHSYETPCVLFLPISGGNADYLNWLSQGCRPPTNLSQSP